MGAKKKHVPGCGCCQTGHDCSGSSSVAPTDFLIALDLFGDHADCFNCSLMNATRTVTYDSVASFPPAQCIWKSSAFTVCGQDFALEMSLTFSGGNSTLSVNINQAAVLYVRWREVKVGTFDMAAMSSYNLLPMTVNILTCTYASGDPTCLITAN